MICEIVIILTLTLVVSPRQLPPFIEKCSLSDPKLADCLSRVAPKAALQLKDGNKDLGMLPLDPITIQKISLGESNSSPVSLRQVYENIKFYKVPTGNMFNLSVSFRDDDCFWRFKTKTPEIQMEADYQLNGQLLVFPINGHGKCNHTLYDTEAQYDIKCEKYMKKNRKHIRVTDLSFKQTASKIVFNFEDLIDGNEQLSNELLKTLNENALSIYDDVGYAFDTAMGQLLKGIVNNVFAKVSEKDLFLP